MTPIQDLLDAERPLAVIYPTYSVNSYGVLRGLGEKGISVLGLDETPNANFASRYCQPLICPSPKTDPLRFIDFLADLGARCRTPPVLYMLEDLYVYLAHQHRARLAPHFRFPFMAPDALLDCIDKRRCFEVAKRLGIPLPRTWYPATPRELRALGEPWLYPVILKPLVARFDFHDGHVSKICEFPNTYQSKAIQANSRAELVGLFQEVQDLGVACCVQELIPGGQEELYGATLYADRAGEVHGIFVRTKIRQTPWDFGTMTYGRAAASPEIVAIAKDLVREIGFTGICGMEFKRDPRDGEYKFLEINPRGELWMNLANRCGVNLPWLKYQDQIGEPVRAIQTDFTRRMVDLREDFSSYFIKYRRDVGAPHHVSMGQWLASLSRLDLDEVIFNWRDPAPGLLRYREYASRVLARRLGCGPGDRPLAPDG